MLDIAYGVGTSTISDIKKCTGRIKRFVSNCDQIPPNRKSLRQAEYPETEKFSLSGFVNNVPGIFPYPMNLCPQKQSNCINQYMEKNISKQVEVGLQISGKGEYLPLKGVINITVNDHVKHLPLHIADSKVNFIPLLGRDWLDLLNPSWKSPINFHIPIRVKCIQPVSELESKFPYVFATNQKSTIKRYKANLIVKEGSGVIHKPDSLAYALRPTIEEELKIMVENGILIPTRHAEIASPIVRSRQTMAPTFYAQFYYSTISKRYAYTAISAGYKLNILVGIETPL
ncbi:hypothetical protein QE152_g10460 [Popillia japonica]|uniref:Uncharacterized protein n=1 Tax=Popillia japonica TaxID=7064 RepID=A0AAW1LTA9_POPJA